MVTGGGTSPCGHRTVPVSHSVTLPRSPWALPHRTGHGPPRPGATPGPTPPPPSPRGPLPVSALLRQRAPRSGPAGAARPGGPGRAFAVRRPPALGRRAFGGLARGLPGAVRWGGGPGLVLGGRASPARRAWGLDSARTAFRGRRVPEMRGRGADDAEEAGTGERLVGGGGGGGCQTWPYLDPTMLNGAHM